MRLRSSMPILRQRGPKRTDRGHPLGPRSERVTGLRTRPLSAGGRGGGKPEPRPQSDAPCTGAVGRGRGAGPHPGPGRFRLRPSGASQPAAWPRCSTTGSYGLDARRAVVASSRPASWGPPAAEQVADASAWSPRPRGAPAVAGLGDPLIRPVQIAAAALARVVRAEPARGRGQLGVATVEQLTAPGRVRAAARSRDGTVLVGEEVVVEVGGLEAVAVILRRVRSSRGSAPQALACRRFIGTKSAEQVVRLPQVALRPRLSFLFALPLASAALVVRPRQAAAAGGKAASPRLAMTVNATVASLCMIVSIGIEG